ncbi:MAG: hypothetical protein ACKVIM_03410 [Flavobacteriales bacterium]|jgi:hypothetical protein|tara:strand:- start:448 stop:606 length:159 start_codon:yes stop_codon:yes gene_type:complete
MHFKISVWNGLFLALVNSNTSVKEIKKKPVLFSGIVWSITIALLLIDLGSIQ